MSPGVRSAGHARTCEASITNRTARSSAAQSDDEGVAAAEWLRTCRTLSFALPLQMGASPTEFERRRFARTFSATLRPSSRGAIGDGGSGMSCGAGAGGAGLNQSCQSGFFDTSYGMRTEAARGADMCQVRALRTPYWNHSCQSGLWEIVGGGPEGRTMRGAAAVTTGVTAAGTMTRGSMRMLVKRRNHVSWSSAEWIASFGPLFGPKQRSYCASARAKRKNERATDRCGLSVVAHSLDVAVQSLDDSIRDGDHGGFCRQEEGEDVCANREDGDCDEHKW